MVTVIINLTGEHWAYIQTLNIRHYKLLINFKWYPELKNAWVYTFHKCFRFTAGKLNRTVQSLTAVYKNLDLVMNKRSYLPQTADQVCHFYSVLPCVAPLHLHQDGFNRWKHHKNARYSILSALSKWKLSAHYLVNTGDWQKRIQEVSPWSTGSPFLRPKHTPEKKLRMGFWDFWGIIFPLFWEDKY